MRTRSTNAAITPHERNDDMRLFLIVEPPLPGTAGRSLPRTRTPSPWRSRPGTVITRCSAISMARWPAWPRAISPTRLRRHRRQQYRGADALRPAGPLRRGQRRRPDQGRKCRKAGDLGKMEDFRQVRGSLPKPPPAPAEAVKGGAGKRRAGGCQDRRRLQGPATTSIAKKS